MVLFGAAIFTAFLAFILIPGLGGIQARSRWRKFRQRIRNSSLLPSVTFDAGGFDEPLGAHSFTGRIEALQGDSVTLEPGMTLHFPENEWHVFEFAEGGHVDIIFFYAHPDVYSAK